MWMWMCRRRRGGRTAPPPLPSRRLHPQPHGARGAPGTGAVPDPPCSAWGWVRGSTPSPHLLRPRVTSGRRSLSLDTRER